MGLLPVKQRQTPVAVERASQEPAGLPASTNVQDGAPQQLHATAVALHSTAGIGLSAANHAEAPKPEPSVVQVPADASGAYSADVQVTLLSACANDFVLMCRLICPVWAQIYLFSPMKSFSPASEATAARLTALYGLWRSVLRQTAFTTCTTVNVPHCRCYTSTNRGQLKGNAAQMY